MTTLPMDWLPLRAAADAMAHEWSSGATYVSVENRCAALLADLDAIAEGRHRE